MISMIRRIPILLLLFAITSNHYVCAQATTCTQTLRLARTTYQQGRLHELPDLLSSCIDNGFTKEERTEAYELLTLSYVYREEPDMADETMLRLLESDHFFEINPDVDPAEFVALYNKFRTKPLYRIGMRVSVSPTFTSPTKNYFVAINGAQQGSYSSRIAFQAGFVFEKDIFKDFSIAPELGYTGRTYDYSNPNLFVNDSSSATPVTETTATFTQSWIDLNLLVHYRFKMRNKNLIPYVAAGSGISYLLTSTGQFVTSELGGAFVVSGPDIDLKNNFQTVAYSAIIAAGTKYKVGGIYLTADLRFQVGLSNVVKEGSRSNAEAVFDYATTLNNIRQSNLSFNVGFVYPYFKPKKLIR